VIPCPGTNIADYLASNATAYGSSKWSELARCTEAHHLYYNDGLVPLGNRPDHFGIGSLFHAAQAWQLAGQGVWSDVVEYCKSQMTFAADGSVFDREVIEESERLLQCYYAHWGEDGGWGNASDSRVLAVEYEMVGKVGGMFYSAKADHIRKHYDEIVVVDTKTSGRKPSGVTLVGSGLVGLDEYARELATRPQFLGLSWITGEIFNAGKPVSLIDDLVIKTKVPSFARVRIDFTEEMIKTWQKQHELLLQEPRRMNLHQCAPGFTRRCDYFDWCHGTDEMRANWYSKGSKQ
jgi:hypothetical protein